MDEPSLRSKYRSWIKLIRDSRDEIDKATDGTESSFEFLESVRLPGCSSESRFGSILSARIAADWPIADSQQRDSFRTYQIKQIRLLDNPGNSVDSEHFFSCKFG